MKILVTALFITACASNGADQNQGLDSEKTPNSATDKLQIESLKLQTDVGADERRDAGDEPDGSENSVTGEPMPASSDPISRLLSAEIKDARPISNRTLSLKLTFEGGGAAAFKPILKGRPRARCEVAAFRLAELLGVRVVPVSTMRKLPLDLLVHKLKRKFPSLAKDFYRRALTNEQKEVTGAVIQWISDLDPKGLRAIGGKSVFASWLAPSRRQKSSHSLAGEAASMIVFDYITGNWDRFSGGNLFLNKDRTRFVLIDNNEAFAPWTIRRKKRMEGLLANTGRFPRRLIETIEKLDAEAIEKSLSGDPWHAEQPLLTTDEVDLLLSRRDRMMKHVNRLTKRLGEENVLVFQ